MESVISIDKYVRAAKEFGYTHLAMMDIDNLYGDMNFLIIVLVECQNKPKHATEKEKENKNEKLPIEISQ